MSQSYRELMIENGMPPADATICEDIAMHAVTEAIAVMERITGTAPTGHLRLVCSLTAFGMMQNALEETSKKAKGLIVILEREA